MSFKRGSGILMHFSSLPGPYGIGDLGKSALDFIDFLRDCKQQYWQFLPIGPSSQVFDSSPYMSLSAFAGNSNLISPELLVEEGYLAESDLANLANFSEYYVEFEQVISFKESLLRKAFNAFIISGKNSKFETFCTRTLWLEDYALFMSLREKYENKAWYEWPETLVNREKVALELHKYQLEKQILFHKFVQFCFFDQWAKIREYATASGITLIGDLPIYVGLDSADVWAHQDCFRLDSLSHKPTHVSGVPPDYFSETGQRWGNPIYKWKLAKGKNNASLYAWWVERLRSLFEMVDIARIDHFRGFESYWEIPEAEETAINGRWVKGPGTEFFDEMLKQLGKVPIIAEDLGIITPEVEELRDHYGFPGMKILQFAFDSDEKNPYLPHNFQSSNCLVYTGTHDNDTCVGWYFSNTVARQNKEKVLRYANCHGTGEIHWDFIRLALSSTACISIIPLQDVLGFGGDCRMNKPSTEHGNWRWRCGSRFITDSVKMRLENETVFYGRG
ncbi:MAG: 4-alpha-glucanotransferase [Proteobacteria bacterium]|nr:4-alpha-glucanotransferase [Pseudomonadota bacterium]MBU1709816.1 4-alpha-glucanotransferase [Pseudomonadota bacterium]